MMKRIVATLFFLSLILCGLALVAPNFIDWSQHKESILAQLEPYIDRKIDVEGKVSFSILPSPEIMLENVTLAGVEGEKAPHLMKLRQLEARMKLGPLLQGRFEIETINLADPELDLEVLPDGRNNWTGILKDQGGGIGQRSDAVQLNNVSMTGGTLHYSNESTGVQWQVDDLNLTVAAETLFGPYKAKGDMRYNGNTVGIEAGTGKYENGAPVPVNMTFTPAKDMPKVVLSGVADLSSGLDLQTQVTVSQGPIAALFGNDFMNGLDFLNEEADATAMLNIKGSGADITDIKAKTGKKGEFSGKISIIFAHGQKPDVTAELSGSDLKVTSKPAFIDVPASFVPHLNLKGKGVTWGGVWVPGVTLTADANDKEWTVKEARIELPGKSKVKLAGVVTPKTEYAAFTLQINSDDAQKMLKGSGLSDGNILKSLGASGLLKKIDATASLDVKADKISLSDIEGKVNDAKISGVLNIARGGKTPKFDAQLNLDQADIGAVLSDAYADFMASLMKSQAELNITAKNFTKGTLAGSDFTFKGKVDGGVMSIDTMTGTFAPDGNFSVSGKLAGVNPLSGMDIDYTVKAPQLGGLAAYGVAVPPPLSGAGAADLKGKVTGDGGKYAFTTAGTAQGTDVSLDGAATQGNQGTYSYLTNVTLKNAKWSVIGLPVDNLLADGKPFNFSAKLSGTPASYQLDNISAGGVTGTLSRKDGKYSGDLDAKAVDFDKWVWGDWKVSDPFDLKLKAKKLNWRSNDMANVQLQLEAGAQSIKVSDFKGELWGGNVKADLDSTRKDGKWKGQLKGKITGADLQQLADLMEFKGFTAGHGDVTLDMMDDSAKGEKDWFHGMAGTIGLNADSLTVEHFNPAALAKMVSAATGPVEDNFSEQALDALRSDNTDYKNVDASFKLAGDGKINIDKLVLADDAADAKVTGGFDLGPEEFSADATVQLHSPAGVPPFTVSRAGKMENPPSYTANVKPIANWLAKQGAEKTPAIAPAPLPVPDADDKPLHETVITPDGATDDTPVQVGPAPPVQKPPVDDDSLGTFKDDDDPDAPKTADPPPAVKPGDDNGAIINTEPIDTEQLDAPQTPPPENTLAPPPADKPVDKPADQPPPVQKGGDDGMKGVLDRLNSLPDGLEPPAQDFNEQKPAPPEQAAPEKKDDNGEILPKE